MGDPFCISLFAMKPLFVRNDQKLLLVVKPFSISFFNVVFHTFSSQRNTEISLLFICNFFFFRRIYFSAWFGFNPFMPNVVKWPNIL